MRVVVGRHGSSADIQVPSDCRFVSRAHARITTAPGGGYLLEDLNSSNGTYVLAHGMWEQITRAVVDASTPILLADYQTSIAELLRSLSPVPQRRAPARPVQRVAAPGIPIPRERETTVAAPKSKPGNADDHDELPIEPLLKIAGLGDLMRVLTTLHAPLRGIRQLVAEHKKALYQAVLAYAAFLTIVPFLHKEVIMRLGSLVSYPIVAQGQAVENSTVLHMVAIVSGILSFMLMYALPKSLYAPSARNLVIATNIYANMYAAFYVSAADLVKMVLWAMTGSLVLPTIFGLIVMGLTVAFQVYIWRTILALRWGPIVLFVVIGLVFSFAHGFILAKMGLVKFG
jgi:FHA domain